MHGGPMYTMNVIMRWIITNKYDFMNAADMYMSPSFGVLYSENVNSVIINSNSVYAQIFGYTFNVCFGI